MSCARTVALGAYLLGSLDPAERSEFERHVSDCARCRDEMVRLAPLPGLLGQLTLDDLPAPEPLDLPPLITIAAPERPRRKRRERGDPGDLVDLRDRHDVGDRHDRRGKRWLFAAAGLAIGALLVLAGLLPQLLDRQRAPAAPELTTSAPPASTGERAAAVTWAATDHGTGTSATAALRDRPWGTEVELELGNVPPGARCKLVVHDENGRSEIGGWWGSASTGGERIPGATSFPVGRIAHLEVVADSEVLVTLRPG
ncbi:zf-HC2 domain-containing protein [Umezawaea beigongshangensis]|uniref:zf-HC2 domain-containing protein n=1 Tax=Umezawaea beigongshangensis TaxID=2780383 RepID=UPI0018F1E637|nr:zf-HC2 domain-containing protein [Umezawaea beigongshangensis]